MVDRDSSRGSKILFVEDEKNVGSTLVERFQKENFEVVWVRSVTAARTEINDSQFDLALVDVGLPDGSGFDVAEFLRKKHPGTAVIFLSAFGAAEDRVRGLELGAEDYIVKPFHLQELILRIRIGLKRAHYLAGGIEGVSSVMIGRARIHFKKFEAEVKGKHHTLTHKEISLLRLLFERRGHVVSRDDILNHAWSEGEFPTPRTVDNFIMRLRRLIEENPEQPEVIKSVRGIGYQLV